MTWQLVLVCCVLAVLAAACVWVALRPDPQLAAMPDEAEPPQMWPLSDVDDGSGPYLRGGSHAATLSGRR